MSSFSTLPNAIDEGAALGQITTPEIRSAGEAWDDETAFGIVMQDAMDALAYLGSKQLVPLGMDAADNIVRAISAPRLWSNGKPRANLQMHVALNAIEKIMPSLYMSLFGQGKKDPFLVIPKGKTRPEAARANASLLSWGMEQSKLREETRLCLKTALTYGWTVGCWGWEAKKQRKKVYSKKDGKMVGKWEIEDIEIPSFECLDLKMVLVDPGLKRQDVQAGAKFIIKQYFTTGYGLADFRDNPAYKNIPTDAELASLLVANGETTEDSFAYSKRAVWREFQAELESKSTSKDPMQQPLEILEYTTEDRVVSILQRKIPIRNQENEFGKLNFQSCAFIDVLNSAWGYGIPKLVAGEQNLQRGVVNNHIDSLALTLNPVFQLLKGMGPGTQAIPLSPGKVVTESGELKPLLVPDVTRPAMETIAASDARANDKVGANGGSNMPNQAMRTAEGVNAFAGDVIQRLQYFLEQFISLVYLPTLRAFLAIMKDHLTVEQVQSILTDAEGKAYEGDIADVYNADCDVDVLAGSSMTARFAAAQLAPMIIQMVSAGPVADQMETSNIKFDYASFAETTTDMLGFDVDQLFVPMTPADSQRVQQKNAAMQKVQGDLMLQNAKHNDNLSEIDAKGSAAAGIATVRQILKTHADQAIQSIENTQNPESTQNGGAQ